MRSKYLAHQLRSFVATAVKLAAVNSASQLFICIQYSPTKNLKKKKKSEEFCPIPDSQGASRKSAENRQCHDVTVVSLSEASTLRPSQVQNDCVGFLETIFRNMVGCQSILKAPLYCLSREEQCICQLPQTLLPWSYLCCQRKWGHLCLYQRLLSAQHILLCR